MNQFVEALKMAFFMFWGTLWALVLGFGLSGVVQAFVSHERMQRSLGDHAPPRVAKASFLGMVSSSCSYAATAMAKSLFAKGADFVTSMVFMFASTNLVVELGVVLFLLMGWQFAAAEFIGGPIMIVLFVLVGGLIFTKRKTDAARALVPSGHHGDDHEHMHEPAAAAENPRSLASWSDAASYAIADLTMLRKELVIGYGVAGFIAVYVSHDVWSKIFFQGHGVWTTIENVLVGPLIAVVSFVCSIGNVPLAAALWHGGLGFGGVISFIFADLITLPLLLIYRKYYGTKLALTLFATFWLVMSGAGLITEVIFDRAGWIPMTMHGDIVHTRFSWNYTTFLNFAFLIVFAAMYWLHRNKERFGGGAGYAIDPVCGMQVRTADAPASAVVDGERYYFCCDGCRDRFVSSRSAR